MRQTLNETQYTEIIKSFDPMESAQKENLLDGH